MLAIRSTLRLILATSALLALGGLTAADTFSRPGPAYQIIVNPANQIESVDRNFLSNVYLKKVATWRNDWTVRPVQLSKRFPLRDQFTREILKKSPSQLRSYWNRQIFSGKAVPPPDLESQEEVISYVLANKGAIGYVAAGVNLRGAKAVRLK
jgi:ABC-type phosphate transport system substrate-binding protein